MKMNILRALLIAALISVCQLGAVAAEETIITPAPIPYILPIQRFNLRPEVIYGDVDVVSMGRVIEKDAFYPIDVDIHQVYIKSGREGLVRYILPVAGLTKEDPILPLSDPNFGICLPQPRLIYAVDVLVSNSSNLSAYALVKLSPDEENGPSSASFGAYKIYLKPGQPVKVDASYNGSIINIVNLSQAAVKPFEAYRVVVIQNPEIFYAVDGLKNGVEIRVISLRTQEVMFKAEDNLVNCLPFNDFSVGSYGLNATFRNEALIVEQSY